MKAAIRISLVGFMGTGKTSTGKKLAARLGVGFQDTDSLIIKEEGQFIEEIFSQRGEAYFRQVESRVLHTVINDREQFVLATGGGIVISRENRYLLKQETFPILLTASPEEIYRRTLAGGRPLLNHSRPVEKIRQLLDERQSYYSEFSSRIATDNKTVLRVVEEIIKLMEVEQNARDQGRDQGAGE